jgi:hypothetical protein
LFEQLNNPTLAWRDGKRRHPEQLGAISAPAHTVLKARSDAQPST